MTASVENQRTGGAGRATELYYYNGVDFLAVENAPEQLLSFNGGGLAGEIARSQLSMFRILTPAHRRSDLPLSWSVSPFFWTIYTGNTASIRQFRAIFVEYEP
ncbi:hypothetical protein [Mesorhizobium sp. 1M-11]|uniref:hypothetical protein n=1 Tax=Mesorhizobium sp. 1M-11 TaxID=1529006 RepID=UPI0006C75D38|nr:hypothetical protein [Mesorhizobium sp. 1M-11]